MFIPIDISKLKETLKHRLCPLKMVPLLTKKRELGDNTVYHYRLYEPSLDHLWNSGQKMCV